MFACLFVCLLLLFAGFIVFVSFLFVFVCLSSVDVVVVVAVVVGWLFACSCFCCCCCCFLLYFMFLLLFCFVFILTKVTDGILKKVKIYKRFKRTPILTKQHKTGAGFQLKHFSQARNRQIIPTDHIDTSPIAVSYCIICLFDLIY